MTRPNSLHILRFVGTRISYVIGRASAVPDETIPARRRTFSKSEIPLITNSCTYAPYEANANLLLAHKWSVQDEDARSAGQYPPPTITLN